MSDSKHTPVEGIELKDLRKVFRHFHDEKYFSLLATVMEDLCLPIVEADALLRRGAEAGYVEFSEQGLGSGFITSR